MADTERAKQRRSKKNAKNRKRLAIIWMMLILVVAVIIVMKISEINFSAIFSGDDKGNSISLSDTVEKGYPYRIAAGDNNTLSAIGSRLAILNDSSYTVLDASDAEEFIKDDHGYANPLIKISGGYSVIYDQGAFTYRLDTRSENVYENSSDGEILCADVADTGAVAIASVSRSLKSNVSVFSKSFSHKMNYDVSGYITAIAIDDRGKNVAFVVTETENAEIKSTLYTMYVNDGEPSASFVYSGSSILDIHFVSGNLYVVGNNFVSVIQSMKKEIIVYEKGSINTLAYSYNPADNLVIGYGEYVGASESKLAYIRQNGNIKTTVDIKSVIKDVSASGNEMAALTGSEVASYKLSNGKERKHIKVDDSYTDIQYISSDIYAKHHSLLEIINE